MKSSNETSYEELKKLYSNLKLNYETQAKELEEIKQKSFKTKEFLDKIESTAKIGYWEFYPKTLKQNWSDEIFRILEYDISHGAPDVPQGMEFIDEKFIEGAGKAIQDAINLGKPYQQDWIVTTKKGRKKWVHSIAEAEIINGEVVKVFGSFQDITEDKLVSDKLFENERLLNEMGEMARVGGWQLNIETNDLIWTKEVYTIHEVDKSFTPTLDKAINFYYTESKNIITRLIHEAIEQGKNFDVSLKILTAKGNLKDVRAIGKVIFNELGKAEIIFGSFQDITQYKEFEQKLLNSDRVFNLTLDMFCIAGFDGYFKYLNPAWEKTLGYPINELLSKPWLDFVHPDDIEKTENVKSVIVDGNELYQFENRYICKDGSIKWLSWNSQPFPDENIMIGAVRDVTYTKEAEQKLVLAKEKAEEISGKLGAALESMSDAVFISDLNGNFIDFNDAFATFHRFKNKTDCAKTLKEYRVFLDVFYPNGKLLPLKDWVVNRALRGENGIGEEYTLQRKDTGETWIGSYTFGPVKNNNGEIVGSVVTARDVTAIKKVEKELSTNRHEFQTWIQNTPVCTKKIDLDFNLRFMSEAGIQELKVDDVNELYGKPYPFYFFPEEIKKTMTAAMNEVKDSGTIRQIEGILADTKGNKMWYNHILVPVKNTDGKPDYILIISTDISKRKKAEQELIASKEIAQENQKNLETILKTAMDGFWMVDEEGFFINVNDSYCKMSGYKREELLTMRISDIEAAQSPEEIIENIKKIKKLGQQRFETKHFRKDRTIIDVEMGVQYHKAETGLFICFIKDITHQKKNEIDLIEAKEKAVQSETQYLSFINNLEAGVVVHNSDTSIIFSNHQSEKLLGISSEQMKGKMAIDPYWKFIYEDNSIIPVEDYPIMRVFKSKRSFKNQTYGVYRRKDDLVWLLVNGTPVLNHKKEIVQAIISFIDITPLKQADLLQKKLNTELKLAKQKAEQSEELTAKLIATVPDIIVRTNLDGNIVFINDAIRHYFPSLPKENILHKNIFNFIAQKDHARVIENTKLMFEKPLGPQEYNMHFEGQYFDFSVNGEVLRDRNSIPTGMVYVLRDITETKVKEVQLKKAVEKAKESDRLKTAFLANMSHEIRTPMNGILGFTDLLQEVNLSVENQQDYIQIIKKSGERLLNTVNDIVEISKIESGQIVLNKTVFDLMELTETLVTFFKPEAEKKGLNLIIQNSCDKNNLLIHSDKTKLNSILSNLIKNAVKYTNAGAIKIGVSLTQTEILLSCSDSGMGIPKHRQEAIFNRFEQADIEDKRAHEGSGLGLAIVKSYVEMLDGKIWVDSEVGKGSTFFISLPSNLITKNEQNTGSKTKTEKPGIKNINVLIVEDDKISAMFLETILEPIVFKSITVSNGYDAIDEFKKDPAINLILMDLRMPGIDGLETTRRIRKFDKNVKIIAQTAFAFEVDRQKALAAGCDDFISKPIKKEELNKIINQYF